MPSMHAFILLSLFFDASCCLIPRLCPGTARVTLRKPIKYPGGDTTASYHYCDSSSNHGVVPPANVEKELLPCQYRDEHFVLYPPVEKNAMFATTRVKETQQKLNGKCANDTSRSTVSCVENWEHVKHQEFYITAVEDFTVMIDHSFVPTRMLLALTIQSFDWGCSDPS